MKPTIPEAIGRLEVVKGKATETPTPAEIRANLVWSKAQFERHGLIVAFDEMTQAFIGRR